MGKRGRGRGERGEARKKKSPADEAAWKTALVGVAPLANRGKHRPTLRKALKPALRNITPALPPFAVHVEEDGMVQGTRNSTKERIRRSPSNRPEAQLDLHGFRGLEAESIVERFVLNAHAMKKSCVLIVHGKGLHSEGGTGVLRDHVIHALTHSSAARVVVSFISAPVRLGGTGALIVQLT